MAQVPNPAPDRRSRTAQRHRCRHPDRHRLLPLPSNRHLHHPHNPLSLHHCNRVPLHPRNRLLDPHYRCLQRLHRRHPRPVSHPPSHPHLLPSLRNCPQLLQVQFPHKDPACVPQEAIHHPCNLPIGRRLFHRGSRHCHRNPRRFRHNRQCLRFVRQLQRHLRPIQRHFLRKVKCLRQPRRDCLLYLPAKPPPYLRHQRIRNTLSKRVRSDSPFCCRYKP
mmetsp:Transcript_24508/g.67853  ORF Transcript_24508/g.67853 Transcript_24508/m.67853 type:complete len:220 (+) Transcript_24508:536-1195(+)